MTLFCKEFYKLVGSSNFLAWKRRISIVLEESEVINHIYGKFSKPFEGQELFEYMERDQRAQGILMKLVKVSLIPYITGLETSKEIYDTLVTSLSFDLHKLKVSKDKGLSS